MAAEQVRRLPVMADWQSVRVFEWGKIFVLAEHPSVTSLKSRTLLVAELAAA
jgi:hypothetical protein